METFVSLLPAVSSVPRTMPGICKMLRKHEQGTFPGRALGTRGQMGRFLSSWQSSQSSLWCLHSVGITPQHRLPTRELFEPQHLCFNICLPFLFARLSVVTWIAWNCKQGLKLRSFSRRAGMWLDSTSLSQHRALHASPHSFQLVVLTEKKPFKPSIQYKSHVL